MTLLEGDCLDVLPTLEAGGVDAVVTDPPYGLEFMGKDWDKFRIDDPGTNRHRGGRAGANGAAVQEPDPFRTKKGSYPSYGGGQRPKTNRCLGCGKRDQFRNPHSCPEGTPWKQEIIDPHAAPPTMLAFQEWCRRWAIAALRCLKPGGYLLSFGGTRTFHRLACALEDAGFEVRDTLCWLYGSGFPKGKGCLKPAWEPILLCRRPGPRVLPLGIDECRVPCETGDKGEWPVTDRDDGRENWRLRNAVAPTDHAAGRYPANVCHDGSAEVLEAFAAFGEKVNAPRGPRRGPMGYQGAEGYDDPGGARGFRAAGTAARFFYCAKASRAERNAGLEGMPERVAPAHNHEGRDLSNLSNPNNLLPGGARARVERGEPARIPQANHHPTVKPLALTRWLVRLVCPPGGTVLDPFAGSGTTGMACVREGRRCVLVEREPEYAEIARRRIAAARAAADAEAPLFAREA